MTRRLSWTAGRLGRAPPPAAGVRGTHGWTDQRVAAKGFLSLVGAEERITVTSLRTLSMKCGA